LWPDRARPAPHPCGGWTASEDPMVQGIPLRAGRQHSGGYATPTRW
jgi:hypothetical protein